MPFTLGTTALAAALAGLAVVAAPAQALAPSGGTITQITVSPTNETEANGNGRYGPVVSDDGRYVAFWSYSPSIVPGDTNEVSDVFLHDTTTGQTRLVTRNAQGGSSNGGSSQVAISANGKWLAFSSWSTNLAGAAYDGDTIGESIYRYSIATGRIKLVSKTPNGAVPSSWSALAGISATGRYVAYSSRAHDIVPGDHNSLMDAFRYDATTDQSILVSHGADGSQTDKPAYATAISGNGRFVAWQTNSTTMGPADTFVGIDGFVYDAQTGASTLVTRDDSGKAVGGEPSGISDNGKIVAFTSDSKVLSPTNTTKQRLAYVYNAAAGTTKLISTPRPEWPAGIAAGTTSISANGRYVAWTGIDLGSFRSEVFLYDRQTRQSTSIAVTPDGSPANGEGSGSPFVSRSGDKFAFCSTATNLVAGDNYGNCDIFLWSRS